MRVLAILVERWHDTDDDPCFPEDRNHSGSLMNSLSYAFLRSCNASRRSVQLMDVLLRYSPLLSRNIRRESVILLDDGISEGLRIRSFSSLEIVCREK